ncbi:unnamed protein product [Onchocerca flexuosa]|uniref:ATS domain-containing protein n=1 Tax=Onchocerca flexuosa TaxID=387005 RepID=A0A183I855_9BILA|nr:unnamed protein product [Onchocerca flexuosa]
MKSRITCDTEVPISTSNGNKFDHCTGIRYHNYSLPHGKTIDNDIDKQYDKPQKDDHYSMEIIKSIQGTTTTMKCENNNHQSSDKGYSGIRSYDIPKDTVNSHILERLLFIPIIH